MTTEKGVNQVETLGKRGKLDLHLNIKRKIWVVKNMKRKVEIQNLLLRPSIFSYPSIFYPEQEIRLEDREADDTPLVQVRFCLIYLSITEP